MTETQRRDTGQVRVSVNGRSYKIGCGAGEEARIVELGQYLDGRVSDLAARIGQVGDERLLLMTALVLADDLAEAAAELETLRQAAQAGAGQDGGVRGDRAPQHDLPRDDFPGNGLQLGEATQRLGRLASRVEDIAARVAST